MPTESADQDIVSRFLEENGTIQRTFDHKQELWDCYQKWANDRGVHLLSRQKFFMVIYSFRFKQYIYENKYYWVRIPDPPISGSILSKHEPYRFESRKSYVVLISAPKEEEPAHTITTVSVKHENPRNNPERDQDQALTVEDALLFLSLYDNSFGIPDPHFFDGAIFGKLRDLIPLDSVFPLGNQGIVNKHAAILRPLTGAGIFGTDSEHKEKYRYNFAGGRELSYEEKKRRLAFGPLQAHRIVYDQYGNSRSMMVPLKLDPFINRIMEIRSIMISNDGKAKTVIRETAYFSNGQWEPLIRTDIHTQFIFNIVVMSTWASQNIWSICIRLEPNAPSVRFFTDPTGIRDFLRFRDLPEGRSRREALAHWVTNHWRQDRHNHEDEVFVREHLRGKTRCQWHKMDVEIVVPPSEKERIVTAQANRKELSQHNKHQRKLIKKLL